MKIPLSTARQLALRSQGLYGAWGLPQGKEGVALAIERLGYVQIDTIAVVERAHHHVLWSRCPDYTSQMLHELQARDRRVFEYWWAYGASYLPISDYRYHRVRMRAFAESQKTRSWLAENAQIVQEVLDRIRCEGPLGSADFEAPPQFQRGPWWSWKPAKEALEQLFWMGELMIAERRNFQRIYDLTERVLPPQTDTRLPDEDETARFIARRTLAAHGILSANGTRWAFGKRGAVAAALQELAASGEAMPVEVEGLEGEAYYALTRSVEAAHENQGETQLHILSPFDNAVIDRGRLKKLFDFDYALECYLPAAERRHGYFSLPILWGERFAGRLDPKADRKEKTLIVHQIAFEPDVDDDSLLPALAAKLGEFATFNDCGRVVIERVAPEKAMELLRRELAGPRQ